MLPEEFHPFTAFLLVQVPIARGVADAEFGHKQRQAFVEGSLCLCPQILPMRPSIYLLGIHQVFRAFDGTVRHQVDVL